MIEAIKPFMDGLKNAEQIKSNIDNLSKINLDKLSPFTKEVNTRNQSLEGTSHPETGVSFERERVKTGVFEKKEGVFARFDSKYDCNLPKELHKASDKEQFENCNTQLKESVNNDSQLRNSFSKEQIEQINSGVTPRGYTWHHDSAKGKMQLVDTDIHAKTAHTGGKAIWGGGSENR